jgi:hypothetical protein
MYTFRTRENFFRVHDELSSLSNSNTNNNNTSESLQSETRAYLILWIFFDFMVVHHGELSYLLGIREYFYKYIFEPNVLTFELYRKNAMDKYGEADFLISEIKKIKFCLRICDFASLSQIFNTIASVLNNNKRYVQKFLGANIGFADVYTNLSEFCLNYNNFITMSKEYTNIDVERFKKNFENLRKECETILININSDVEKMQFDEQVKNDIQNLIMETTIILNVLYGDINAISELSEGLMEFVLMNIYYRFYEEDFFPTLKQKLSTNEVNIELFQHIIQMISLDPLEFFKYIKGEIPIWLQFHFMDILDDLEYIPYSTDDNLDGLTLKEYEYVEFLNYLLLLDVSYHDFSNYFTFYDISSKTSKTAVSFLEKIVIRNVTKEFSILEHSLSNNEQLSHLKDYIRRIVDDLNMLKDTKHLINSIGKICYNKFVDFGEYQSAIEFYNLVTILDDSSDTSGEPIFLISKGEKNNLFDRECMLDKLFYHILTSNSILEKYSSKLLSVQGNNYVVDKKIYKIEFLYNLIHFNNLLMTFNNFGEQKNYYDLTIKVRQFFTFCFVEQNCPKLMWLWTMKLFKNFYFRKENIFFIFLENSEIFKEIKYQEFRAALDLHSKHEIKIRRSLTKFWENNKEKLMLNQSKQNFQLIF